PRSPSPASSCATTSPPTACGRRSGSPARSRRPRPSSPSTSSTRSETSEAMIDFERLASWMDGNVPEGKGEPIEHRLLSGGSQNELYDIQRGELHCAIRIPPPEAPADRDNGILREWRIIHALEGTDVPHTRAVAMCDDPSVLGRP